MATFTLATLRSRVRQLGDFENSTVFTDAFINDALNEAVGEYCDLLDQRWEGYRDTVGTLSTVANTATVTLPTDFLKARAVDMSVDGRWYPLGRLSIKQAYGYDSSTGRPVGYLVRGAVLELFPTPDAVYSLRLRYVPAASTLSADGDSIDVPNGWEGFIVHTALLRLDEREERPVNERMGIIERYKQRIIEAAADRNAAEPEYLALPGPSWELFR